MILHWYPEDRTGTLFADVLQTGAVMCILPLRVVGKGGYEVIDPDGQVAGCFYTVDEAKDAAAVAAERWFKS